MCIQTPLSLQSMAERFASVLEQISMWSNLTKDETSTLATVLLESVESTTLAALLKPSANGSQIIQTEHLGRLYPSWQGHTWVPILRGDFSNAILHGFPIYHFPNCFKPLNSQRSKSNHINNISYVLRVICCVQIFPALSSGPIVEWYFLAWS